jgi:glycerol kinase
LAAIGKFDWALVPGYCIAQVLGAMAGATGVWLAYLPHWAPTEDVDAKRGIFCTAPAIRQPAANLLCEVIGTAVLVGGVLAIAAPHNLLPNSGWDRGFAPFLVGVLVWSIGLSLGGPRVTPSIRPVTLGPDWHMPFCRSPARDPTIGVTPGCRLSDPFWEACSGLGFGNGPPVLRDMKYVLALDQGTTSSRAILFDRSGAVCAVAQKEFPQIFPKPGWVEHDPDAIWSSQFEVMQAVLDQVSAVPTDIASIGITNQRETTLVWDRKTGRPIHNAIVWQDRRTASMCDALKRKGAAGLIRKKTGLVVDAYFSGTKLSWLLKNVPGARAKAKRGDLVFGTVDTWLVWNLTGGRVHVTDPSNASRTLLFNLRTGDWDDELLELFQIPRDMLPHVGSSSEVYGHTMVGSVPVPVAGIAGDQQAALFGQVCHRPGMVKNTYGTGCFLLMHTGDKPMTSRNNLLTTVAWKIDGRTEFALEGSVFIAGAVVQWLRDGLGILKTSAEVETVAASVPDNGGVYLVPAFAGLGAPHWMLTPRGLLAGVTRGTTAGSSRSGRVGRDRLSGSRCPGRHATGLGYPPA